GLANVTPVRRVRRTNPAVAATLAIALSTFGTMMVVASSLPAAAATVKPHVTVPVPATKPRRAVPLAPATAPHADPAATAAGGAAVRGGGGRAAGVHAPAGGTTTVTVAGPGGTATATGMPVRLGTPGSGKAPAVGPAPQVRVAVADQATAMAAGVDGILVG